MQYLQQPSLFDITCRLDAFENCDPEFDVVYEDLDREFAHRRLHLDIDGGARA